MRTISAEVRAAAHGRAHVVRERTDVSSGGALDRNFRERAGNFVDVKIVDFNLHRLQLDRFFLAREFVCRAAMNFFRGIWRRHLRKAADARGGEPLDFNAIDLWSRIRAERRAVGVVGVRGKAEAEGGVVALAAPNIKLCEARGAPEQQHQNARRQRVERAEMADLPETDDAAHRIDHVVRRSAARLVDDQCAVERCGLRFSVHGLCGTCLSLFAVAL